jgi:hypothetical protein
MFCQKAFLVLDALIIFLLLEFSSSYNCRSKCGMMILKSLLISQGIEIALRWVIINVLVLDRVVVSTSCRFKPTARLVGYSSHPELSKREHVTPS